MEDRHDRGTCAAFIIHDEAVDQVRTRMLPEQLFDRLAETFQAMGQATRVKILYALSQQELCVCDLAGLLDTTPSAISHQLRILRNLRLVKNRKDGKVVFYSLDDDHIAALFEQGLDHVRHG